MVEQTYNQLMKNWKINHNHTMMLLKNFTREQMELKNRVKGRTVHDIFKHMIKNKFDWLENLRPKVGKKVPDFDRLDLETLEEFASSWIVELIEMEASGEKIKGFKSDLFGLIVYLISHDSHHRGQILQILKDKGIKLSPQIQYGIWEWN